MHATRRAILILCLAVAAAFANSFSGAFVFDDLPHIANNPKVRAPKTFLEPLTGTGRPWVQGSLAINHAISGLQPWSYHATNLALHLGAALCLFGILRRILGQYPALEKQSTGLALAIATLWAVHPLQTESVTYVIQRAEAGMGLCILLMLYALLRSARSRHQGRWLGLSVGACVLGYGFKPIMVIAPVLAVMFDRCFLAGSYRAAWQVRRSYYAALAASVLVLVPLLLAGAAEWKTSAGFSAAPVGWLEYARTQPSVVLYYLRLVIWPNPLCLDYGWPVENRWWVILPSTLAIVAALWMTARTMRIQPGLAFAGAWVFINLAPTSSVMPIADLAFEHRMYLALISPLALLVLLVFRVLRNRPAWVPIANATAAIVLAISVTVDRNRQYQSALELLLNNAEVRPDFYRPHLNLALELERQQQFDMAAAAFQEALRIKPDYAKSHFWYGRMLHARGKVAEARTHYQEAVKLEPDDWNMRMSLGTLLANSGEDDAAREQFEAVLRIWPEAAGAHMSLGVLARRKGDRAKAAEHFKKAAALAPRWPAPKAELEKLGPEPIH